MNERLKELRNTLKLTQAELAKRLGVTQSHIGALETGRRKISNIIFKYICDIWDVNPTWLKEGKGDMFINIADNFEDLDSDTKEMLFKYQKLNDKDKDRMKLLLNSFLE